MPAGFCALDAACFDTSFPCDSCCEGGTTPEGKACWDSFYTNKRCCRPKSTSAPAGSTVSNEGNLTVGEGKDAVVTKSPGPVSPSGQISPSSQSHGSPPSTCEKDWGCFSDEYPCTLCCLTDFNRKAKRFSSALRAFVRSMGQ